MCYGQNNRRCTSEDWAAAGGDPAAVRDPSRGVRAMMNVPVLALLPLLVSLLLAACRAKPAPDSGFLRDPKLMTADKALPFNRMYVNPKFKDKRFTEIYVAPVNTDYVMRRNAWERAELATLKPEQMKLDARLLGEYLRRAFIKAAERDPKKHFKVVDQPGPDTLILELAIVQLAPSKVVLQALGAVPVGPFGIIGHGIMMAGSALARSEDQGEGVIAIEGRTRDGSTGEIVWMFADRERPPQAIVDVAAFFWWEPLKPICDGWARQFVQLQNAPPGAKVKKTPIFKWLAW